MKWNEHPGPGQPPALLEGPTDPRPGAMLQGMTMRDKAQFAEDLRHHIYNVLLNDDLIDLAFGAGLAHEAALDILHPLITRRMPFLAQTLLHNALRDPRTTLAVLESTMDALRELPRWEAPALRAAVIEAAARHRVGEHSAQAICSAWLLFGPSPLELYTSMQALGREAVCRRCEQVGDLFRANLLVS